MTLALSWFLYLIECEDGSVYTGITTDVDARFAQHANGARYTRARKPRAVLAPFPLADRSSASRAEYWVKRLTPVQKRALASGQRTLESVLPAVAAELEAGDDEAKAAMEIVVAAAAPARSAEVEAAEPADASGLAPADTPARQRKTARGPPPARASAVVSS